ncbi:glutathione S-transferase [Rhodoblastus sphagnicola]|uniref:Glutathione S-transferase n=1 Tax=Rhodoblastus sphagnicola TaxID=333368 RepID=A0A2S6NEQ6_9HYPH|nr:glutathione S-transferase family protein [Rhodoblastus sphagnicola]MBB4196416.1 glutathione S-transferase [Rhodoblastus sphagnicola]PPQ33122.1 glutathione S-transferase [Rhodoblastus sphagnicola]
MKLYWAPQSRALRALWLLEEIGCAYQRVTFDLRAGTHRTPEFHAVNPMEKVPALQDGAACVAESGAIFAYLIEKFPDAGLAPPLGDPLRGRFWQWLFFASANIEFAMVEARGQLKLPEVAAGWGSAEKVFNVIEEQLSTTPYIVGEKFSACDIMLATNLHFAITALKLFEPRPVFDAYLAKCRARPAFLRAVAIDSHGG